MEKQDKDGPSKMPQRPPGVAQSAAVGSQRSSSAARALAAEIGKAVIGQPKIIEQLLVCLIAGGHALLEGLPGLGKTLLCRSLAQCFGGQFARIQFTPDLMPADITGHSVYNPTKGKFLMRRGPVFTNLLLADEINRAPAKTQAALLEVMQEYQITLDGRTLPVARPFMTVATQNPIELEGTYPLPEAQLDRFLMKILLDYPDAEAEKTLVARIAADKTSDALDTSAIHQVIDADGVLRLQAQAAALQIDPAIVNYAVDIVRQSRQMPGIAAGASPRAAIALVRCARATALMAERDYVAPDDVKQCAPAVLRHRIRLTPELEIEGRDADQLLDEILDRVEAPRS